MSITNGVLADAVAHTRRASYAACHIVTGLGYVFAWCIGVVDANHTQMKRVAVGHSRLCRSGSDTWSKRDSGRGNRALNLKLSTPSLVKLPHYGLLGWPLANDPVLAPKN